MLGVLNADLSFFVLQIIFSVGIIRRVPDLLCNQLAKRKSWEAKPHKKTFLHKYFLSKRFIMALLLESDLSSKCAKDTVFFSVLSNILTKFQADRQQNSVAGEKIRPLLKCTQLRQYYSQ
jgi:hypothetical protein